MSTYETEKTLRQLIPVGRSRAGEDRMPGSTPRPSYLRCKGILDRFLAALLLIPCLPILGVLILLIRLTSRGSGMFCQTRVGKDRRLFTIYKLRSMRHDAEAKSGPVWATKTDCRTTRLGNVLRKLHLDEIPQLFNVLKGDMSLVGPRPERPEFVRTLAHDIPRYLDRLTVLPGITGLAQVNLAPDADLDSVRRKLSLDLQYIKEVSFLLDLRLLFGTFLGLLGLGGSLSSGVLRLKRNADDAETFEPFSAERRDVPSTFSQKALPAAKTQQRFSGTIWDRLDVSNEDSNRNEHGPTRSKFASTRWDDPLNAFTVDVEDYFQVSAFEGDISRRQWGDFAPRVVDNTRRILRLLDRYNVRATFFVLGWTARRNPQLVKEIQRAGHEIGSHGYWHRLIYQQTPAQFRRDVRRSRDILADITGTAIHAYRAPSFSITRKSLWALDILAEEGFSIDSSIFPIRHDRYGMSDFEPNIQEYVTPSGKLWEFPLSVARFGGMNVPVSGGGYFRLLPLSWTSYCLGTMCRRDRKPFVFYIHPWEVDPDQPLLKAGSMLSKFRHRVNLAKTEEKLGHILGNFRFARLCDVIQESQEFNRRRCRKSTSGTHADTSDSPCYTC